MQEYGLSLTCILPYKNRIYHSVFIRENAGQRKPVFSQILCRVGLYLSKVSKQHLVFGHFWLFSQNNQPTLDWKFKNDWTKRLQRSLKNVSLSLAKSKLAEKNEWKFFNQSGESCTLPYTSQIKVESFSLVALFREWLYDSQFSQIKYRRRPSNIPVVECLSVKLQFN